MGVIKKDNQLQPRAHFLHMYVCTYKYIQPHMPSRKDF